MTEPYIGEIRMFAGSFAPVGWALCNGALLQVSQNEALFSLLGTTYGGDGRTTFGLPDLQGRVPVHYGSGPGLTNRNIGAKGGVETVTLTVNNLPSHTHAWRASGTAGNTGGPTGKVLATSPTDNPIYVEDASSAINMSSSAIASTGGGSSKNNLMPYLTINFIIALVGIYPSRN